MSSVYVFGAGASTEYHSVTGLPIPVDRSFWGIAEKVIESPRIDPPKLTPQEKLDLEKLVATLKNIYDACYLRDLDRVGLERVFSEISNQYPDMVVDFQRLLEWTLFQIIRGITEKRAPIHYDFVRKKLRPGDTIVSFNYDVIIDQVLWDNAAKNLNSIMWNPSSGYGMKFAGYRDQLTPSKSNNCYPLDWANSNVFVYKLHGSLGWFSSELDEDPVLYLSGPIERRRLAMKGYLPGKLVLVPPIRKKVLPRSLSEVWKIVEEVLKKADKIYFIGYRLSEADYEAQELFGRSCKDKAVELVLKWDQANGEIQRLKNLFPNLTADSLTSRKFSEWLKNA